MARAKLSAPAEMARLVLAASTPQPQAVSENVSSTLI